MHRYIYLWFGGYKSERADVALYQQLGIISGLGIEIFYRIRV